LTNEQIVTSLQFKNFAFGYWLLAIGIQLNIQYSIINTPTSTHFVHEIVSLSSQEGKINNSLLPFVLNPLPLSGFRSPVSGYQISLSQLSILQTLH